MRKKLKLLTVLFIFLGGALLVARPRDSGQAINVDRRGNAAFGADVVAYQSLEQGAKAVKGKRDLAYEWKGATWLFSTEENLEAFKNDPERYAPHYGGYCANAMSQNTLAESDPNAWHVLDGELFLFNRKRGRATWLEDTTDNIGLADGNWPDHRETLTQ